MNKSQKKSKCWHCHCLSNGMSNLNRTLHASFALCTLLAAPAVKADPDNPLTISGTVMLNAYSGVYPNLGGGEFTAYTSQNFNQYYAAGALLTSSELSTLGDSGGPYLNSADTTGFETFCIETGVEYTPGNWPGGGSYYYSLGNVAQPVPPTGSGSAISLTTGAAWLYYEFATAGNFGGYATFNYTYSTENGEGTRQYDDDLLQAAIWALQGGQTYDEGSGPPNSYEVPTMANNMYYAAAIDEFGLANATNCYNGSTVQILQMWTGESDGLGTGAAQNQLVLTSDTWTVPDVAETAGLLGIAFFGIVLLRSRTSKLAQQPIRNVGDDVRSL
jgi:hypothetical protein